VGNLSRKLCGCIALAVIGFSMASCGANPKGLAKQRYDLRLEAVGSALNPAKAADATKKVVDVEKKAAKLSAADKIVYEQELARLTGQGVNSLLDAASGLDDTSIEETLDTAGKLLDTAGKALDTAKQANDLLNSIGGNK